MKTQTDPYYKKFFKVKKSNAKLLSKGELELAVEADVLPEDADLLPGGWILKAAFNQIPAQPIEVFRVTWSVPQIPADLTGQQIFLFMGINNRDILMQCMLKWGRFPGNGEYRWMVSCCHETGGNDTKCTPLQVVNPGAIITAEIIVGRVGNLFYYEMKFLNIPNTYLKSIPVPFLPTCCMVLESYSVASRGGYPSAGTVMEVTNLRTAGGPVHPNWQPRDLISNYGQHAKMIGPDEVLFDYGPQQILA
ncbi:hypothetical protein [Mucilaginibacter psychrotolerans]|uniref:Uncharacterized protein n=1 Tax=Mucilaginibacter psychrotolerans TaxID=1524096 RepID=A0A4Y8S6K0_9SPHI|nr:hypothetical protein [Mucilaginibacter psychrotolerans]TFF34552.1 hypothetical protein E2R66_21630 [Mucilaginibacter psychrotolerans]